MKSKKNSFKTFFLNIDIQPQMAGIEISALNRSKIFCDYLGLDTNFLTIGFNNALHKKFVAAIKDNRCSKNLRVESLYDFLANAGDYSGEKKYIEGLNFAATVEEEANPLDVRGYNEKGEILSYCRRNDDLTISYVNYISSEKIVRRETYDSRGFLIRSETMLDRGEGDSNSLTDVIHRVDGTSALVRLGSINKNVATINSLQLLDNRNSYIKSIKSDQDLIEHWLRSKIKELNKTKILLMVDRGNEWFLPALSVKREFPSQVKLLSVIHGVHAGSKGDVFAGASNGWYKSSLESLPELDALIVLTERQKNEIEARYINSRNKIFVLPHSFEINQNPPTISERKKNKLVYVARFSPEKRHLLAIDIFIKVLQKMPDAELHFYGFGSTQSDVRKKINENSLDNKAFINDYLDNVREIYASAGLSILTSDSEGFCMGIVESLSNGCPVVAFDVRYGPSELIKNKVNGLLVRINDIEMFANGIIEILTNENYHQHLIQNAAKSVEKYSHENLSKEWGLVLSKIMEN